MTEVKVVAELTVADVADVAELTLSTPEVLAVWTPEEVLTMAEEVVSMADELLAVLGDSAG